MHENKLEKTETLSLNEKNKVYNSWIFISRYAICYIIKQKSHKHNDTIRNSMLEKTEQVTNVNLWVALMFP